MHTCSPQKPVPADPPADALDRLLTELYQLGELFGQTAEREGWPTTAERHHAQRVAETRAAIHAEVQRRVAAARGDGLRLTDAISSMVALERDGDKYHATFCFPVEVSDGVGTMDFAGSTALDCCQRFMKWVDDLDRLITATRAFTRSAP